MSSSSKQKNRSYSFFYKIYRRLKFVRFKQKLAKQQKKDLKLKTKQELQEHITQLNEFRISEKRNSQLKRKFEREEKRKRKKELKAEFSHREKLAKEEWKVLSLEDKRKNEILLQQEKKERKRQLRQSQRNRIKNLSHSLRSINYHNIKRNLKIFRENAPNRRRFLLISINSTILFLLSYFTLFLVSQAITVVAARFFDYPTTVHYYEIYFNINQESWFHDSVKTIFSAGPVVNFVIGITFLIIYSNIRELSGSFKLFFLWGFLHSVNMLFGSLLVGTLFETGVGHVISWLYIMDTGKVLYSIISIFLLVIAGLIATKQFLISGNTYYNEINKQNSTSFIFSQVITIYGRKCFFISDKAAPFCVLRYFYRFNPDHFHNTHYSDLPYL